MSEVRSAVPYSGPTATYVALCAVTTLSLAMVNSIWLSDVSGASALLGLLAIYLASSELLVLYSVFSPASVLIDIIRVYAITSIRGKAWLVFFTLLETIVKVLGAIFAWSLYKTVTGPGYASDVSPAPLNPSQQVRAVPGAADMSVYHPPANDNPFNQQYTPPPQDYDIRPMRMANMIAEVKGWTHSMMAEQKKKTPWKLSGLPEVHSTSRGLPRRSNRLVPRYRRLQDGEVQLLPPPSQISEATLHAKNPSCSLSPSLQGPGPVVSRAL
eukprot:gene3762-13823_t